jgi:hypothetical protein
MIKTGNIFFDFVSFLSVIFPLLPAGAIFLKKNYRNDSLNFLMILCLLSFIRNLLLFMPGVNIASQNIITNIFELLEFMLLAFIFRNLLPAKFRSLINILFSVFLSVVITVYLLKGSEQKIFFFEELKNIIILFTSIACIVKIAGRDSLDIFDKPIFWIASGSLFYFTMEVLIQSLGSYYDKALTHEFSGNMLLLNIGNIARYFFYLLGNFFYDDPMIEREKSD